MLSKEEESTIPKDKICQYLDTKLIYLSQVFHSDCLAAVKNTHYIEYIF